MEPINEPPPGYRPDGPFDRLRAGCGLILGGIVSMGVAFLMWQVVPLSVPVPPGMPSGFVPIASPIACMIPLIAVLAAGLVLLGVWKLIGPE
jgi:hypothetical protein